MFNQFIKNINNSIEALPILASMQQQPVSKQSSPPIDSSQDFQRLVQALLKILSQSLSEKLGEAVDEREFKDLTADLLRSRAIESQLIQAKQKYNELAGRSSNLFQQARKISAAVGQFITSINLFLQSQELLVPLREIQKGINQLSAQRVEKQMNYLIRIFQSNFQEVIDKRIKKVEVSLHDEIKLLKNLNKNLQAEILAIKGSKNQDESKVYEYSIKITNLNEKISKLTNEKSEIQRLLKAEQAAMQQKQSECVQHEKELIRLKGRQVQLLEKVRNTQAKVNRSQRNLKEQNSETEALNNVIERLKLKQEEITEQLERENRKKEQASETLRKKLQNEKVALQDQLERQREKYAELEVIMLQKQEDLAKMIQQLKDSKERGDFQIDLAPSSQQSIPQPKTQQNITQKQQSSTLSQSRHKISVNDLLSRLNTLQTRNKQLQAKLQKQLSGNVNKQVLKSLFLSYDDESKEWSVRRNIKLQIYSLLDFKDRLPQPAEEVKPSKWFGIF